MQLFTFRGWCLVEAELQKYIKRIIIETREETASTLIRELERHKLIKPTKDNTFNKAEKLLYNYNNFKQAIDKKLEQIESIQVEGLAKRSKSIVIFSNNNNHQTLTDAERAEAKIEEIQASIEKLEGYIRMIDDALDNISNDKYFDIIKMKYFDGLTHEDISFELDCDISTVARNKNRLIHTVKIYLFPDDSMVEFFI